jgi:hypothetical protein
MNAVPHCFASPRGAAPLARGEPRGRAFRPGPVTEKAGAGLPARPRDRKSGGGLPARPRDRKSGLKVVRRQMALTKSHNRANLRVGEGGCPGHRQSLPHLIERARRKL